MGNVLPPVYNGQNFGNATVNTNSAPGAGSSGSAVTPDNPNQQAAQSNAASNDPASIVVNTPTGPVTVQFGGSAPGFSNPFVSGAPTLPSPGGPSPGGPSPTPPPAPPAPPILSTGGGGPPAPGDGGPLSGQGGGGGGTAGTGNISTPSNR
jgi:hypothetical protein